MISKKLIIGYLMLTMLLLGCAKKEDSNFGTYEKHDIDETEVVTDEHIDTKSDSVWSLVKKEDEEDLEQVESEVYDLNNSILVHDESKFDMDSSTLVYLSNIDTAENKYIFTFYITNDEWGRKGIEINNLIINNNIAIPDESIEFDDSKWKNSNSISKITLIAESKLLPEKVEIIEFEGILKHYNKKIINKTENFSIIRRTFEVELYRN